jgi:signal transduction histidine kinase
MAELIRQIQGSKFAPSLVLVLALGILGASVFLGTDRLRRNVRAQMVNRDGEILHAVALAQQLAGDARTDLDRRLQDPAQQLALALDLSRLKEDVLAVRLYDAEGRFVTAFPPYVAESSLDANTLLELKNLHARSRYFAAARLSDWVLSGDPAGAGTATTPVLEVNIPIQARNAKPLLAAAQLVLDARHLEASLAKLDWELWRQALAAYLAGALLLSAAFLWAYRSLQKSQGLLQERSARLLRANLELTLAAKTGALGAVAAHLVHGLCNPLASLQSILAARNDGGAANADWEDAAAATRRMQTLVHEVVRVLGEETAASQYEITLAELGDLLSARVQAAAQETGVVFAVDISAEGKLANRHANLVVLIIENLVQNALQATPRGQRVQVTVAPKGQDVVCEITDAGPGLAPHLLKTLFAPCRSTKGGSGLGLAISRQLANQLDARLELKSSGPAGCVFALTLPGSLFAGPQSHGGDAPSTAGASVRPWNVGPADGLPSCVRT